MSDGVRNDPPRATPTVGGSSGTNRAYSVRDYDHQKVGEGAERTVDVKKGETLSAIAGREGVPMSDLIAANPHLKRPRAGRGDYDLVFPGDVVAIPKKKGVDNTTSAVEKKPVAAADTPTQTTSSADMQRKSTATNGELRRARDDAETALATKPRGSISQLTGVDREREQKQSLDGLYEDITKKHGSVGGYLQAKDQAVTSTGDAVTNAQRNGATPAQLAYLRADHQVARTDREASQAKVDVLRTGYRQLDDGQTTLRENEQLGGALQKVQGLEERLTTQTAERDRLKQAAGPIPPALISGATTTTIKSPATTTSSSTTSVKGPIDRELAALRQEGAANLAKGERSLATRFSTHDRETEQMSELDTLRTGMESKGGGSVDGYLKLKQQAVNAAAPGSPARSHAELDLRAAQGKVDLLRTGYQAMRDGKLELREDLGIENKSLDVLRMQEQLDKMGAARGGVQRTATFA
jgi:LysM repeat protein